MPHNFVCTWTTSASKPSCVNCRSSSRVRCRQQSCLNGVSGVRRVLISAPDAALALSCFSSMCESQADTFHPQYFLSATLATILLGFFWCFCGAAHGVAFRQNSRPCSQERALGPHDRSSRSLLRHLQELLLCMARLYCPGGIMKPTGHPS